MASRTSERAAHAERVLTIFPGALGDLVCLVPALRALARRHRYADPAAALELMAREELARFMVDRIGCAFGDPRSPSYSRSHSIDRREVAALFAQESNSLSEPTAAAQFFRPFTRIYSFFASDDARFRHALEAAAAPGAVSFHAFRPAGAGHVAAGYLDEIGERNAPPLAAHIEVLEGDIAEARRELARLGLAEARVVLFFPGSGSPHKNWPADSFVALASALASPMRALFVLGPAEGTIEPVLMPLLGARRIAWLRDPPLATVAGLARIAAGFVGNDSGVSHLAAAAGAPGVAIFGPTDPDRWRPLGCVGVVRALKLADLTPVEVASALRQTTSLW